MKELNWSTISAVIYEICLIFLEYFFKQWVKAPLLSLQDNLNNSQWFLYVKTKNESQARFTGNLQSLPCGAALKHYVKKSKILKVIRDIICYFSWEFLTVLWYKKPCSYVYVKSIFHLWKFTTTVLFCLRNSLIKYYKGIIHFSVLQLTQRFLFLR